MLKSGSKPTSAQPSKAEQKSPAAAKTESGNAKLPQAKQATTKKSVGPSTSTKAVSASSSLSPSPSPTAPTASTTVATSASTTKSTPTTPTATSTTTSTKPVSAATSSVAPISFAPAGAVASWRSVKPALSEWILKGVDALGFKTMTPVQASTLPSFLTSKDVCVQAVTGSGKTLSFAIPTYEIMLRRSEPWRKYEVGAIVLSPTRELAQQICKVFQHFVPFIPAEKGSLRIAQCIGGRDVEQDVAAFKQSGANVIVATPGRLETILTSTEILNTRTLEVLVLDEADRILSLGFQKSLTSILAQLPKQRRTGLFSATLTDEVEQLAKAGLRNPVKITVKVQYKKTAGGGGSGEDGQPGGDSATGGGVVTGHQAIPSTLRNYYSIVKPEHKLFHLVNFLKEHKNEKVIVFFLTCACVDYVYSVLSTFEPLQQLFACHTIQGKAQTYTAEPETTNGKGSSSSSSISPRPLLASMHGRMPQSKRDKVYATFKTAPAGALFCTDVAARGVDIPQVDWILQFDAPQNPEFFVHRYVVEIMRCL